MIDLEVIDRAEAARSALDPTRARILATLVEPGSASTVAAHLGLPRQRVNYHLRALEDHGLVELVEERPRRGLTERVMQASAEGYTLSPELLGDSAAEPDRVDRLSSRYLVAVAARIIRDVAGLSRRAEQAGKPLATLTIDTEIRLADPSARAAFTTELAEAVAAVCARHHDEATAGGRWHRVVLAAHPRPAPDRPARTAGASPNAGPSASSDEKGRSR